MRKKTISLLGAFALFAGLASVAPAQQLYINKIDVGDGLPTTPAGNPNNCNNNPPNGQLGISRSFVDVGNPWRDSSFIQFERPQTGYPGSCLSLCASIVCVSTAGVFGIDELTFEVFKFGTGANPLDPASTPPIKTINMYNIGTCNNTEYPAVHPIGTYCASWDGSYNLNGIFGKSNGQFGFRARVKTNQVSPTAGNIAIEQTAAFPGQNQIPIQVNVTNIHTVRSSPTVVGKITGVGAQPYNILYRLSKDAITSIQLYDASVQGLLTPVRAILVKAPRVGEGTPDGTLTNGDSWDGKDGNGNFVPAGNYIAELDAYSNDAPAFPTDNAWPAQVQISLDPLQITDIGIKPLGVSATDTANISYMLTEAATVYINIYTPGTNVSVNTSPPTTSGGTLLRSFVAEKDRRVTVTTMWDGRDSSGSPVCDGNYVYAIWAEMPSSALSAVGGVIRTMRTMVGIVPVARGSVVANLMQSSTIIGSSPTATALDPFYFSYIPARDTSVSLNIKSSDGITIVRNLLTDVPRTGAFLTRDTWDGKDNNGAYVPAGDYMAELVTHDAYQCAAARTSTSTVRMSANLFRIVDVQTKPLLGGASEMANISFNLSQPMYMELNVYPPSVTVNPSVVWPAAGGPTVASLGLPVYSAKGMRPGRFKITEYWDGRNEAGQLVEDGRYPFVLLAHSTGTATTLYATDKTYGYVDIARGQIIFTVFNVVPSIPTMFSSSDSVTLPPYQIDYSVTRQSSVTVQIWTLSLPSTLEATVTSGQIRDGDILYRDFWDGKDSNGSFVPGGAYNVRVTAQDMASTLASRATVQTTIDVFPLRIYDVAITPLTLDNPAVVSYQVSEPMKVVTNIYKPGTTFNSAGVPNPPEAASLVKRIVGVRAARMQVSEYWDGTDMTLSKVPDGNYMFKVYASPDTDKITTSTGAVLPGALLADDVITSNISVTRGASSTGAAPAPKEDFMKDTFFYPNPYTGNAGCFHVGITSVVGNATIKIYNLAGDLVYKSAEFEPPTGWKPCTYPWNKTTLAGRTVAPGVYFAVVRFAATQGSREVWQTVKKILVP
jgi:flagellar hook assembly protein FlgD